MSQESPREPGALVAIGGAEDKTSDSAVLGRVMSLMPPHGGEIAVITTASTVPDQVFAGYETVFAELGARAVHHLDVQDRAAAREAANVAVASGCDLIFFAGGDQLRLTNVLGGSPLLDAIRARHTAGATIAGTSAGAAAMSSTMIYDGAAANALRKGAVKMSVGLGFVDDVVIDSHFLERGRFTRLMEVGATNPAYVGIGIGEDAAVIIRPGPVLEAVGQGLVIIVDSSQLRRSNVAELEYGEPVAIEHVIMHALTSGYGYDVERRAFLDARAAVPSAPDREPA